MKMFIIKYGASLIQIGFAVAAYLISYGLVWVFR